MSSYRLALLVLLGLSISALVSAEPVPSAPPAQPAHVLSYVPAKFEVAPADLRNGIRVTFDRDMIPPADIGKSSAGPAFEFTPALAGEVRWIDVRTLAFFPKAALATSTMYQVRLASRLAKDLGRTIETWPGLRFVHDRIRVTNLSLDGDPRFSNTLPVIRLGLSQPSTVKEVIKACTLCEARDRASAACTQPKVELDTGRATPPGTHYTLSPDKALQAKSSYHFRCAAGLGPMTGDATSLKEVDLTFSTFGPAAVASVEPSGTEVPADNAHVAITFTTPVDASLVRDHVELIDERGASKGADFSGGWDRLTYAWSGNLDIGAAFGIRIKPGLKDIFGQPLPHGTIHTFRAGDLSPKLRMERGIFVVERTIGRYPAWARNLETFHIRCAEVPEPRLAAVLTGPSNYDAWMEASDSGDVDYKSLHLTEHEKAIRVGGARNQWHDVSLNLAELCGTRAKSGVYLLESRMEGAAGKHGENDTRVRRSLASVTDLGLVAKVGNASSLVWVVSLSTGKPVAGAKVRIRDLAGKVRFEGATNADGVAQGPGATRLADVKPQATGSSEENGEENESEGDENRARRVIVTAQTTDDLAVLDTNWNNGIQVWNFGVSQDHGGGNVRVRGFLHSDRGLYRPGDSVHLKGLVRFLDVSGSMTVPTKGPNKTRKVHLVIKDSHDKVLADENLAVSEFGGFHKDLVLPAEANLGDYKVRGEMIGGDSAGQGFGDRFSVEEYKPRTFEVKVVTGKKDILVGQPLRFDVKANFLYGSPLRDGKVAYSVRRRQHLPEFRGFDNYVFQDYASQYDLGRYWAHNEERSFSELVGDGEAVLDRTGAARVTVKDTAKVTTPQDYIFETTVTDATGESVTKSQVVTGHTSNLYLGLHPSEFVQAVDMPFAIQVVGMDREGNRKDSQAELEITRRSYDCGPHGQEGTWSCETNQSKVPAIKRTVTIPAAGSAAVERVVLKEPGEYVVRVSSGGKGDKAAASEIIWVIGEGEAFWSGDEGDRMTVVASKPKYAPGDTALLVPQTQLPGSLALVTLERDGILSYSLTPVATSGQGLKVKVTPELAPNVFASVTMVRGRTGDGDRHRPRFKMGLVDLQVESTVQRLQVTVDTERPTYQPGEEVKATVRVTSATGEPVQAELALAVADEGVLQIVGFKTPDPMAAFYAPFGWGVESATTWNRILRKHELPDDDDNEEGGDGGGDEAGRIRSRFMATAFWTPALLTDADGRAQVKFKAPDNLTAFRVMAVGADLGARFGSGDKRFTVAKPLQAIPALPRFLAPGDHAQAAVAVHNNTDQKLDVAVTAKIKGVLVRGGALRKIRLAAHAYKRVTFNVVADHDGDATFVFLAEAQDPSDQSALKDAVQVRIPVRRAAVPETLMVGEGSTQTNMSHDLPALGEVLPGKGGLELTLDRTGMGRLDEGLAYLVGYPYGCLEQTTSKVVPMIALADLARNARLPGIDAGQARKFIDIGIAKILRHQHEDGGFGLWIGATPEPHYTATGLWGLSVAKAAGFTVDEEALERGAAYLRQAISNAGLAHGTEDLGVRGTHAFAEYVLATLGHADAGLLGRMYEDRATLPIYGRAFLLRALVAAHRDDLAKTLASELWALAPSSGPGLIHEVNGNLSWYWSSDVRTTALVVWALAAVSPSDVRLSHLSDALLKARVDGRWGNTQENVFSLLALADLAKARASAGKVSVTVRLGDTVVAKKIITSEVVDHVFVPLAKVGTRPLSISMEGGEIFYSARIRVERALSAESFDHGMVVERAYLNPEDQQPLTTIHLGQQVLVRITVSSPMSRAHVAVVDRLPAGFEPVLKRFSNAEGVQPRPASHWTSNWRTLWQNEELRDDRMQIFADTLGKGTSSHEYLVRAATTGTFIAPPTTAEAMYDPAVQGRSPAQTVEIEK